MSLADGVISAAPPAPPPPGHQSRGALRGAGYKLVTTPLVPCDVQQGRIYRAAGNPQSARDSRVIRPRQVKRPQQTDRPCGRKTTAASILAQLAEGGRGISPRTGCRTASAFHSGVSTLPATRPEAGSRWRPQLARSAVLGGERIEGTWMLPLLTENLPGFRLQLGGSRRFSRVPCRSLSADEMLAQPTGVRLESAISVRSCRG